MTELERYIRAHAGAFDTQEPARGHEERFLARLDVTPAVAAAPHSRRSGWFRSRSARLTAYALAAVAAVVLVLRPGAPRDFRHVPDDPEAIYLAYMDHVAGLYNAVPAENSATWDTTLQEITEEKVPLFEQLPDELSARERGRILKAYYGDLLAGARKLKNNR
jgi:hypothetical protein